MVHLCPLARVQSPSDDKWSALHEIRSRGRTKPLELPSSCRLEDERKQLPESPDQVYLDFYSVYIIHYSRFTKNRDSLQQMFKWTAILLQPDSSWFQSGNFLTVAVVWCSMFCAGRGAGSGSCYSCPCVSSWRPYVLALLLLVWPLFILLLFHIFGVMPWWSITTQP